MTDTSVEITDLLTRRYAERTPADRVRMAAGMFRTARRLVQAGVRSQHAGLSGVELRVQVLQRLYGGDLSSETIVAIAQSVDQPGSES